MNDLQLTYNYVSPAATANCSPRACGNTSLQFPSDPEHHAAPGAQHGGLQHGIDDAGRSRDVRGVLRAGSVDAEAPHRQRRASLRSRDERLRGNLHRAEPVRARTRSACRPATASTTTTSRRAGAWRGTSSAPARRRSSGTWASTSTPPASAASTPTPTRRAARSTCCAQLDRHRRRSSVDCDLMNFTANGECSGSCRSSVRRPGHSTTRGTGATRSASMLPAPRSVCRRRSAAAPRGHPGGCAGVLRRVRRLAARRVGQRRSEWQFGLGIQHEILPRLSAEFTYNRRNYSNLTVTDQLGIGCDRFNGAQDRRTCQDATAELLEPVLRLLLGDCADRSASAGRRRLQDPRPERLEADAPPAQPTAQTYMGRAELPLERLRHQLRLARPAGIPRKAAPAPAARSATPATPSSTPERPRP